MLENMTSDFMFHQSLQSQPMSQSILTQLILHDLLANQRHMTVSVQILANLTKDTSSSLLSFRVACYIGSVASQHNTSLPRNSKFDNMLFSKVMVKS